MAGPKPAVLPITPRTRRWTRRPRDGRTSGAGPAGSTSARRPSDHPADVSRLRSGGPSARSYPHRGSRPRRREHACSRDRMPHAAPGLDEVEGPVTGGPGEDGRRECTAVGGRVNAAGRRGRPRWTGGGRVLRGCPAAFGAPRRKPPRTGGTNRSGARREEEGGAGPLGARGPAGERRSRVGRGPLSGRARPAAPRRGPRRPAVGARGRTPRGSGRRSPGCSRPPGCGGCWWGPSGRSSCPGSGRRRRGP